MSNKIVKEIVIIVILIMITIFMLLALFYDSVVSNKQLITSVEYKEDENVVEVLEEIHSDEQTDVKSDNSSSLLKAYTVSQNDLEHYASENSYESGKTNPFDEYLNNTTVTTNEILNITK